MSPRILIAAQSGVVIGLLGLTMYQARQLREAYAQLEVDVPPPIEAPGATNQRPLRLRLQQLPPINIRTHVHQLDWRTIESEDYATYIANLRRIGCPESTIRDILLADINKLYSDRRRALAPPPKDWEYWRHPDEQVESRSESDRAIDAAREEAFAALERERRDLVARLLGPAGAQAEFEETLQEFADSRDLQFLPPEKRAAAAGILARWEQALQDARLEVDPERRAQALAGAEADLKAALTATLTPGELEEYEMRASPLAEELRDRLRGFQASRDEFEALYRLERAFSEEARQLEATAGTDPQAADKIEAARAELDERIQETLGPQRFQALQRAQDPDFQTLFSLALSHDVPTEVASQVWDMRRAVEEQSDRVRENPLLTLDQKRLALEAIRRETQGAIVDVLGEPLLQDYERQGGDWLYDLTAPPPAESAVESREPGVPLPPALPPDLQQALAIPVPPP